MDLIRQSIERPVAVIAAVILVVLFGALSLQTIPVQLAPDVRRPVIAVRTSWPGAAPAEVEREIVNRQEDALRGVDGLVGMTSSSSTGSGRITLEFQVGQNMDRALLLVANRLDRVSGYPAEVDEPTLDTAGSEDNPIAWFTVTPLPGNDRAIETHFEIVEDTIKDALERVDGIALVNIYGGAEREMVVEIDPARMARYGLTVPEVVDALRRANVSITGGTVDEGKRSYTVRTDNEFSTLQSVRDVVLRSQRNVETGRIGRVTVDDIGQVNMGHKELRAAIRVLGEPAMAVNTVRETGANVIETMVEVRAVVAELNERVLPAHGLRLTQVDDETIYINAAIDLVRSNILFGGALAAIILLVFLRSWRATLVVSLAIPVSVVGSFVAMAVLGRSLNVVSLAGLAFAVGMVVDAAIVVLENIYRMRQQGMGTREAAYHGARQVWGAVFVSALTTVLVFTPILIMELEIGQLFRDIAVAISVAVLLSLVVSITLVPALASWLLGGTKVGEPVRLWGIDDFAGLFNRAFVGLARRVTANRAMALTLVIIIASSAIAVTILLTPKREYMPDGNRNFVFARILPPPGYNLDTARETALRIEDAVRQHWIADSVENVAAATAAYEAKKGWMPSFSAEERQPKISAFFFVALNSFSFAGARAVEASDAGRLIPIISRPIFSEPGTFGFATQPSIFGRGIGGNRAIDLDVAGGDLTAVLDVAGRAFAKLNGVLPREQGSQIRPIPGLEFGAPEVRLRPDPIRLADNGVSARTLGQTVDAFNDGLRVAEITVDGDRIDLTLSGPKDSIDTTQGIGSLPVVTSFGRIIPAEALADVAVTAGPTQIRHKERARTVTLQILPPQALPLEAAMELIEAEVITALEAEGLPPDVRLRLSGTADKLQQTSDALTADLIVALIIVFLAMAVLFESFWYPLIVLIAVPVAAAGGFIGLGLLNLATGKTLDMLTMLGFVILIGIVVNNAILLVDQSIHHHRNEGLSIRDAIIEATRNRIRPIFMSTLTSVFGMVPLMLMPGAGSELYQGLGTVVVGGLSLSALLTLLTVPPLLGLLMPTIEARRTTHAPIDANPAPVE